MGRPRAHKLTIIHSIPPQLPWQCAALLGSPMIFGSIIDKSGTTRRLLPALSGNFAPGRGRHECINLATTLAVKPRHVLFGEIHAAILFSGAPQLCLADYRYACIDGFAGGECVLLT